MENLDTLIGSESDDSFFPLDGEIQDGSDDDQDGSDDDQDGSVHYY